MNLFTIGFRKVKIIHLFSCIFIQLIIESECPLCSICLETFICFHVYVTCYIGMKTANKVLATTELKF